MGRLDDGGVLNSLSFNRNGTNWPFLNEQSYWIVGFLFPVVHILLFCPPLLIMQIIS